MHEAATQRDQAMRKHAGREQRHLRRCLRLLALGWVLLATSALVSGAVGDAGWAAAVVGVLVLGLTVPLHIGVRGALRAVVGVYANGLALLTIAAGAGLIDGMSGGRVELFAANPNLLGAGLVTSFAAWSAVAPGRRWVWWGWPLVAVAVLQTGSRTALAGLLAAFIVWLIVSFVRRGGRGAIALAIGLGLLTLTGIAAWQLLIVERTVNLVTSPNDFTHPSWVHVEGASVTVIPAAAPGPFDGTVAQRVIAQASGESGRIMTQSIGLGRRGVPYVASVYLRSDEPQRLQLRSHLTRTVCEVGFDWQRCTTPVGYGTGSSMVRHEFWVVGRGGSFDVFLYGAQTERSETASTLAHTRPTWLPPPMIDRFDLRHLSLTSAHRDQVIWDAIVLWRSNPLFGVGRQQAHSVLFEMNDSDVAHAHNQAVQVMLETGVVGLVGWLVVVAALVLAVGQSAWWRLLPMTVALVVLNTWDATLFDRTGFYAMVVSVGVLAAAGRRREPTGAGAEGGRP